MRTQLSNLLTKRLSAWSFHRRWKTFRRADTPLPIESLTIKALNPPKPSRESEYFPGEFDSEPPKGRIYDNRAFPMPLVAGKEYKWCMCGFSKSQPMCDGSHRRLDGDDRYKTRPLHRPLSFSVTESKIYHMCNCKQSSNRPFCDGTHRRPDIQNAIKP